MTYNQKPTTAKRDAGTPPDWIAKCPKQIGRKERLERVGAAWRREDGGICLRLHGTQIISEDIYLYPAEPKPAS
ncbi:MAG: hypothetical protein Kilf2KO_34920 [Rhodospirillales bacterium]